MYVNYEYYRIFYYVALCGGFTQAAAALHSNQPNITRAMNRLEDEVGCTLFIRTNRGVQLTPEGEGLLSHIRIAVNQIQQAEKELDAAKSLGHGSISISATETALHLFLLPILQDFHFAHPAIRLHISNHTTPRAAAAVQSGDADFALVTDPLHVEAPLQAVSVLPFQEILIGGKTFSALSSQTLSLQEIGQYSFIGLGSGTTTYTFYQRVFLSHGLTYEPDTSPETADQILPLVRSNLGLAFLPRAMAQKDLADGQIVQIHLREEIPARHVYLLCNPTHPLGRAAKELRDDVLEAAKHNMG